jgi:hypothetical protein
VFQIVSYRSSFKVFAPSFIGPEVPYRPALLVAIPKNCWYKCWYNFFAASAAYQQLNAA